jgi:hypothetical protein
MHVLFQIQKTVFAISFATLLAGPSLIYASDKHDEKAFRRKPLGLDDPRPKYALFSWRGPNHAHRFALVSNNHGSEEVVLSTISIPVGSKASIFENSNAGCYDFPQVAWFDGRRMNRTNGRTQILALCDG